MSISWPFYSALGLSLLSGVLLLLAPFTVKARERVARWEQLASEPKEVAVSPEPSKAKREVRRAAPSRLLLGLGVLASLLVFLWPVVILLNSYLIALALSTIIPSGAPLFTLRIGPWVRDIYMTDLVAVLVSLFQAIGGAAWLRATMTLQGKLDAGQRQVVRNVARIALALTMLSILFEFCAAAYPGLSRRNYPMALSGALNACVAGLGEVTVGALVIDFLLIPLAVGVIAWLFPARVPRRVGGWEWKEPRFPWLLRFLAALDVAVMERLRKLDGRIAGWWNRRRRTPVTKEPTVVTTTATTTVTMEGSAK